MGRNPVERYCPVCGEKGLWELVTTEADGLQSQCRVCGAIFHVKVLKDAVRGRLKGIEVVDLDTWRDRIERKIEKLEARLSVAERHGVTMEDFFGQLLRGIRAATELT